MKARTEVALAIGAGYLLGRTRKMRLAMMVATAGATGGLGKAARVVAERGSQRVSASPELAKIAQTVQGELLQAVRTAAVTAASSRIDSLSSKLTERAQGVPGRGKGKDEDEDGDTGTAGKGKRRARDEEPSEEDRYEEEEPEEAEPDGDLYDEEEEEEEEPEETAYAEDEEEEEDEPARRPVPRQRNAKSSSPRRAPVRRAGR